MDIDDEMRETIFEENAVKGILKKKVESLETYNAENSELIAYQLAEIIVSAKNLYTKLLPELMQADAVNQEKTWELITSLRMHLMHLRDCIDDFDGNLFALMEGEEEESE